MVRWPNGHGQCWQHWLRKKVVFDGARMVKKLFLAQKKLIKSAKIFKHILLLKKIQISVFRKKT